MSLAAFRAAGTFSGAEIIVDRQAHGGSRSTARTLTSAELHGDTAHVPRDVKIHAASVIMNDA